MIKNVTVCPRKKRIKVKGKRCMKCQHYNKQKWFSKDGPVEVFCSFDMNAPETNVLKNMKKFTDGKLGNE